MQAGEGSLRDSSAANSRGPQPQDEKQHHEGCENHHGQPHFAQWSQEINGRSGCVQSFLDSFTLTLPHLRAIPGLALFDSIIASFIGLSSESCGTTHCALLEPAGNTALSLRPYPVPDCAISQRLQRWLRSLVLEDGDRQQARVLLDSLQS